MTSRFTEFCNKEVINTQKGIKIGYVDDVIFDTQTAQVSSLVVYGRARFFGLFGRGDDMIISWDDIVVIGEDAILIKNDGDYQPRQSRKSTKPNIFDKLFG